MVWLLDVPPEPHQDDLGLLGYEELERYRRFARREDGAAFAASHAGARRLLGAHLGVAAEKVTLSRRPCPRCASLRHGPPVARTPAGEIPVSLSRSGTFALVAAAGAGGLGADIEVVEDDFPAYDVAQRFFTPDEAHYLAGVSPEARTAAFFRCWVRKEAVAKAQGTGLVADLRLLPVWPARPGPVEVHGPVEVRGRRATVPDAGWSMIFTSLRAWPALLASRSLLTGKSLLDCRSGQWHIRI